ncbi:argonaute-like protein [Coniophora puteana RWD-64-598 SS2]|uniref:Argonaute-like protein n=1 Tax=Coniophora puteana (strain RWD-64-598) TaxID=741705 RepID=A0A5M3N181_CONPW|nr:argonaute-like protein [Coniophora puteana RWD-64-598 SS2]EIW84641.1 argonaute-like protein [Coniophora puteana RWD-64-598 SS2]
MPPKASGGRGRGAPRGGPPPRGGTPTRGRGAAQGAPGLPASHVQALGVKRPGYGTAGRIIHISANFYEVTVPEEHIHHYDGALIDWPVEAIDVFIDPSITPSEATLPEGLKRDLIEHLQEVDAPHIFAQKVGYDGNKNIFSSQRLNLGPQDAAEFDVSLGGGGSGGSSPQENTSRRRAKSYKLKLTKVNTINPEMLHRLVAGQQSPDNEVQTALTAMNVVLRMDPIKRMAHNRRSFFTNRETLDIGGGIELWRGFFQSIRPAIGRIYVNVDISTAMMAKPGPLFRLCLEFLNEGMPPSRHLRENQLTASLPERDRRKLEKFIFGIGVHMTHFDRQQKTKSIRGLSNVGASGIRFKLRDGQEKTVASYFRETYNTQLRYPDALCIKACHLVGRDAMVPLELCTIPPGQILKKEVPSEKIDRIREFSTKRPEERLRSINAGLSLLAYGQSEYVRHFGMAVNSAAGPAQVPARVLPPPPLKYAPESKISKVTPAFGAWNMADKRFIKPAAIETWAVAIYERQQRFNQQTAQTMVRDLIKCCQDVGIQVRETNPVIEWFDGQGNIHNQLRGLGAQSMTKNKKPPTLVVVILPENGNDIYIKVKNFGDVKVGVATQCMKASKCFRAKTQYYANVCLKINVKLGGINTVTDTQTGTNLIADPRNPTIVMGADVMHPGPGSDRPSFTAIVGSVDSNCAKYVASSAVQSSRVENIDPDDFKAMAKQVLTMYRGYGEGMERKPKGHSPARLFFYRDGVSEGQFQQVLDFELPALRAACAELGMKPKITFIIVAKRHHTRLFPNDPRDADRSGNCHAGTVVDTTIVHPVEWDWYLQSHAGILGTSRSAHYNVLFDENKSTADGLQAFSYALCHVYARATRSVSIPAPVYYADIVCSRAKHHYDPARGLNFSESASNATATLQRYKAEYQQVHQNMQRLMYFS